ncbi:peptide/nickel transport system substrate-binding protein [Monaibacterium marinum]|uniref:Peptide/nickel transport system substrate-binding protein n=1 Tax=Pontivivens marinum TaxID=1690039 RepID=A0A2C9CR88_9RHOB|nr:extracellular solute-binding protein [Monaibacterium marinum]SOH93685.1 peptide/nickel transport system substrate-binding protein [Monaibacterium marinum]
MSRISSIAAVVLLTASAAAAQPQHGIAMYGEPALPPDFAHLPYVNPEAPTGGIIVEGARGSFDSLNPFIQKGSAPYGTRAHVAESLLGRSYDEPFTLYGLLAESVEMADDRTWVEFHLNPAARFSDGSPVTVEDVIWSFETMGEQGHARYRSAWDGVVSTEQTGERSVRFNLTGDSRELPLILGLRPVLKKADWDDVDFTESSLRPFIASGPYTIGDFDTGRFIQFDRNPDYWGADLNFNVGRHNLDAIRYEFFGDGEAAWQAFTSGETSYHVEYDEAKWVEQYNFPAVERGDIVQSEVAHQRPTGMSGLVFNTRSPIFADIRVRDALLHVFNFEFINERLNAGVPGRIESYFDNSLLGFEGEASARERELLEPYLTDLPADVLSDYTLPVGTADLRNRRNLRAAQDLLTQAGWTLNDGVLQNGAGEPFVFEMLLSSSANEAVTNIFAEALQRLGITMEMSLVDSAQYAERLNTYDYDMIAHTWGLSLSPGTEQINYWGSRGVQGQGTRNYAGIDAPAAGAMIDAILSSEGREDFVSAVNALDRVLTTGRYVIPFWYSPLVRVAHKAELHYPADNLPIYGYWIGFMPDVWWSEVK